jgi:hypothetical protein
MWKTNQNYIYQEIKNRLNSGNAYYHALQNVVFPAAYKMLNIEIYSGWDWPKMKYYKI